MIKSNDCVVSYGGNVDLIEGNGFAIKVLMLPLNSDEKLRNVKWDCGGFSGDVDELFMFKDEANLDKREGGENDAMKNLTSTIGGLRPQLETIIRRITSFRSAETNGILKDLGIKSPKGLLLFGPPGCGKTAIARALSNVITSVEPKTINAPELMSRFVGSSERNVRTLFEDAISDYEKFGGESELHVVVIDEIDAAFR